jgi:hypothetical protein
MKRDLSGLTLELLLPDRAHPGSATAWIGDSQWANLQYLEQQLHEHWMLGRNLVMAWAPTSDGADLLVVPNHALATFLATYPERLGLAAVSAGRQSLSAQESPEFINMQLRGSRKVTHAMLEFLARLFEVEAVHLHFPRSDAPQLDANLIDRLVERYGITLVPNRAVALFDIVEFSLLKPLEQVAQINSLSYSINSAQDKMERSGLAIQFARSSTGDGFYIWNRDSGISANINLYKLMLLTLADNAIARRRSRGNVTPELKAAFHIGSNYEFYQYEKRHPISYSYIVGDVTIELARMIAHAVPGQVLVGDFTTSIIDDASGKQITQVTSGDFIERLRQTLGDLHGVVMSDDRVTSIRCYLTGRRLGPERFSVERITFSDKHGLPHRVYNAKINIYRKDAEPIYLGIQQEDLPGARPNAPDDLFTAP